jgi:hypothetical protein
MMNVAVKPPPGVSSAIRELATYGVLGLGGVAGAYFCCWTEGLLPTAICKAFGCLSMRSPPENVLTQGRGTFPGNLTVSAFVCRDVMSSSIERFPCLPTVRPIYARVS